MYHLVRVKICTAMVTDRRKGPEQLTLVQLSVCRTDGREIKFSHS